MKIFCPRNHNKLISGIDKKGMCIQCKLEYGKRYRQTEKGRAVRLACERKYRESNRLKRRRQSQKDHLKSNYGITEDQYVSMLLEQNNKCAICKRSADLFRNRLGVDHDHKTGDVRGLLCSHCNAVIIGILENNETELELGRKYLQNWLEAKKPKKAVQIG